MGNTTMQNPKMGFLTSIRSSRSMICQMRANLSTSYCLTTNDIPGRSPSIFSTGRAFTSKVFKSY